MVLDGLGSLNVGLGDEGSWRGKLGTFELMDSDDFTSSMGQSHVSNNQTQNEMYSGNDCIRYLSKHICHPIDINSMQTLARKQSKNM